MDLRDLIAKLTADERVMGLVAIMQPLDVFAVVSSNFELQHEDAKKVVSHLLNCVREGMASPGIESNKKYPVPAVIRRGNENLDEYGINNVGQATPDLDPNTLPQQTPPEADDWPFDAMTKAIMDPHARRKRPLMQGPFDPNLEKNKPGMGASGIQSRNVHPVDNSTSQGGTLATKGSAGWSSTPQGKEFDIPDDSVMAVSPVGSQIPQFQGGHSQQRRLGFRRR